MMCTCWALVLQLDPDSTQQGVWCSFQRLAVVVDMHGLLDQPGMFDCSQLNGPAGGGVPVH